MIVDLFAGPGGWDEGLRLIGVRDVVGLEWDDVACNTAEAAGHVRHRVDVALADPADYQGAEGLIASPPCPDWSQAGKASASSMHRAERAQGSANLTHIVLPWVRSLRPAWVACEQVRDVLPVWRRVAWELEQDGYRTWTGLVNTADYGVPQSRVRALLVASVVAPVGPPTPTHTLGGLFGVPAVTAEVALGLEPGCWIDRRNNSRGPQNTVVPVAPAPCSRPAPTVTGQASGGQWVVCHPDGSRRNLTVAQGARLQSFRDDYPWHGTKGQQAQQVGNAVPPLLARAVLAQFVQAKEAAA